MLSLPSPQSVLPIELGVIAPPELQTLPETLPPTGLGLGRALPQFAGLLAAQVPPLPAADGIADSADPPPDAEPADTEPLAITQAWALVLVPELANLPAPIVPATPAADAGPVAGDAAGDAASLVVGNESLWPQCAVPGPRLAVLRAADPGRPRDWQAGLPAPPPAMPPPPITPPPTPDPVLRNITGQPIPYPTADQPPWYDPRQAPAWFDPANPPPAWSDPTQPAPLWYDPTKLPPAWLDPARVPAAWFDAPRPAVAAASIAAALIGNASAEVAGPVAPQPAAAPMRPGSADARPPVMPGQRLTLSRPLAEPAAAPEPATVAERAELPLSPPSPPPAIASAAPLMPSAAPAAAASSTQPSSPAPLPDAAEPALAISSDRLGDVSVRLSGGPDQLQVAMQAQPAAAALIGADAGRLSQDLAAAGVALAGLNVNGQRADFSGGQQGRQRQSPPKDSWRDESAPIAAARRLAARSSTARSTLTIDRFA